MCTKKKRGRETITECVQDAIDREGLIFYDVCNHNNEVIWHQSTPVLQKYSRDVLDALASRWAKNQGCAPLNTYSVGIKDNKAFLPEEGSCNDSKEYANIFEGFIRSVYGPFQGVYGTPGYETAGYKRGREDFCQKLTTPNLTLDQFQNLYFHTFLQSQEEMTDFPAAAVENLHDKKVWYKGSEYKWEQAYRIWERHNYKKKFDLFGACIVNIYAWRAYNFRTYTDDAVDEAHLVQNFIKHFNQCRMKDIPAPNDSYNKRQIGQIVFGLFPDIGYHLFDFMSDCGVCMDFAVLRTYFRL